MKYVLTIILLLFFYSLYEYRNIKVKRFNYQDFKIKDKQGLRILFISDIQYDCRFFIFQKTLAEKLVKMINQENPDLVLIGGDFITRKNKNHKIFTYLKDIKADKIGIIGNHDYHDLNEVKKKAKEANIKLLINETYDYQGLEIIGLDNGRHGKPKLPKLSDKYRILLVHDPDDYDTYAKDTEFDLILAGHLHGGQVTLFGKYAPILPSKYYRNRYHGFAQENMYISSGLGGYVFCLPIRFFAAPEIVIIEL